MASDRIHIFVRMAAAWRVFEQTLLAVLVSGMVFLAAVQIILRNFFQMGFNWADPLLGVALLWLTMIGALVATGARKHINMDLVTQLVAKHRRWLAIVPADLFAAVVCALLGMAAVRFVGLQKEMEPAVILNVPLWVYYEIIPVCLFLMSFRFVVQAAYLVMHRGQSEAAARSESVL